MSESDLATTLVNLYIYSIIYMLCLLPSLKILERYRADICCVQFLAMVFTVIVGALLIKYQYMPIIME